MAKRRKGREGGDAVTEPRVVVKRERSEKWLVVAALDKAERERDQIAKRVQAAQGLAGRLSDKDDQIAALKKRLLVVLTAGAGEQGKTAEQHGVIGSTPERKDGE